MLSAIITLFSGLSSLTGISQTIANAYAAKQAALTDQDKIAADIKIATLEAKRDVMVAESRRSPINAIVRLLFALPVAIYYGKIFVIDKVLALGSTDALSDELTWTARVVIGFYFLYETANLIRR